MPTFREFFSHLTPSVWSALLGMYGMVLLAQIIVWVRRWWVPHIQDTELRLRVRSWWWIITLVVVAVAGGLEFSLAFLMLLSGLSLYEYLSLIPKKRKGDSRIYLWGYAAVVLQYYWIYIHWYGVFIIFIPVYVFLMIPVRMIIKGQTQDFLKTASTFHWGLMSTVFSVSHLGYLLALPEEGNPIGKGPGLLMYLVLLTELNDVAQYVWGRSFGRKAVVPSVSPGKTWEGLIGGVLTSAGLSFLIAPHLTPISGWAAVGFGAFLSLAGFFGDLSMSMLKRDIGVKDSGKLIPGHGGILDRVDSLTYTAPLFFHVLRYFYY